MKTRRAGCLFGLIKLFVLTILITGAILYFSISYIVPVAVSSVGKIMGIDMDLGGFSFSILEQSVELENFYINNPEGFRQDTKAINLNKIRVDMDSVATNYLFRDLIVIDEVVVDGFELSLESTSILDLLKNNNNLTSLLANLESEASKSKTSETRVTKSSDEVKIIIKNIIFTNGKIKGAVSGATLNMALPNFKIVNVGVAEGGLSILDAGIIIFEKAITQSLSSVAKATGTTIGTSIKEAIDSVGTKGKSIFDGF